MPSLLDKTRFLDPVSGGRLVVAAGDFRWEEGKNVVAGPAATAVNNAGTSDLKAAIGQARPDYAEPCMLTVLDGGAKVAGAVLRHALYVSSAEWDGARLAKFDFSPDRDAALALPRMTAAALRGQLRARFGVLARVVLAADYEEMFRALLASIPEYDKVVQREIAWAKKHLRKQDRIVWYLRWVRLACAYDALFVGSIVMLSVDRIDRDAEKTEWDVIDEPATEAQKVPAAGATGPAQPKSPAVQKYEAAIGRQARARALYDQYRKEILAKGGDPGEDDGPLLSDLPMMQSNLEHFMGIPVPEIQGYSPKAENWRTLYNLFSSYEQAWKEKAKKLIKPQPQDTVWMQFGDGWAWWLLPRASCDDESRAMGHCGNSPMRGRTDVRILSLRQPVKVGKETWWEPHCTFILHDGGAIGEMKGKNNDKPTPRYHPYIVALLKDKRVTAVMGGGYWPEHNFAMADLTDAQRAEIKKANPSVGMGAQEYWQEFGMDEALAGRIKVLLGLERASYDPNYGFVLRKWDSEEDFIDDCGDRDAKSALEFVETGQSNYDSPSLGDLLDLVEKLDEREVRNMGLQLQYDSPKEMREWYAGFDPGDKASVAMAVEDLFNAYVKPLEDRFDKALKAKQKRISEISEAEDGEEKAELEKAVKEADKPRDVWAKVPTIGNLYWAYISGGPDRDSVRTALDEAIERAEEMTEGGSTIERSGDAWLQVMDDEEAVALAERAQEKSTRYQTPDEPNISLNYDWDDYNEDRAADSLRTVYSEPPKRPAVDRKQRRLFPEPRTEEQARRRGITISRLTNPLFAPAEGHAPAVY